LFIYLEFRERAIGVFFPAKTMTALRSEDFLNISCCSGDPEPKTPPRQDIDTQKEVPHLIAVLNVRPASSVDTSFASFWPSVASGCRLLMANCQLPPWLQSINSPLAAVYQ
jgi:hypothetical protein